MLCAEADNCTLTACAIPVLCCYLVNPFECLKVTGVQRLRRIHVTGYLTIVTCAAKCCLCIGSHKSKSSSPILSWLRTCLLLSTVRVNRLRNGRQYKNCSAPNECTSRACNTGQAQFLSFRQNQCALHTSCCCTAEWYVFKSPTAAQRVSDLFELRISGLITIATGVWLGVWLDFSVLVCSSRNLNWLLQFVQTVSI